MGHKTKQKAVIGSQTPSDASAYASTAGMVGFLEALPVSVMRESECYTLHTSTKKTTSRTDSESMFNTVVGGYRAFVLRECNSDVPGREETQEHIDSLKWWSWDRV